MLRQTMDVFRDGRGFAVRHAVFPEIAFPEICRHHLQLSRRDRWSSARAGPPRSPCLRRPAIGPELLPLRRAPRRPARAALPIARRNVPARSFQPAAVWRIEIQQARLRARVKSIFSVLSSCQVMCNRVG